MWVFIVYDLHIHFSPLKKNLYVFFIYFLFMKYSVCSEGNEQVYYV